VSTTDRDSDSYFQPNHYLELVHLDNVFIYMHPEEGTTEGLVEEATENQKIHPVLKTLEG